MQSLASYYVRMVMAGLEGSYDPRPLYEKIYEFIIEYIKQHGTRRGAFAEAARIFYSELYEKNPSYAATLVLKRFRYAIEKKFREVYVGKVWKVYDREVYGLDATLENPEKYDLGYIVSQSRPLRKRSSRFRRDMEELPRSVFEFKKLLHAMLRDVYNEKLYKRAADLLDALMRDKRVLRMLEDKKVWYNGRSYVKVDPRTAALAYIVLLKIHMKLYGLSQPPRKLIAVFTAYTNFALEDLRDELKKLASVFYDWFLLLN